VFIVDLPDGSIIGIIQPNLKVRVILGLENFIDRAQNLRQRFRVEFGRSTGAGCQ